MYGQQHTRTHESPLLQARCSGLRRRQGRSLVRGAAGGICAVWIAPGPSFRPAWIAPGPIATAPGTLLIWYDIQFPGRYDIQFPGRYDIYYVGNEL